MGMGEYGSAKAPLLKTELLFRVMDRLPPKIARRFTMRTVVQLSLYGPWLGSSTDVGGNGMRRSTSETVIRTGNSGMIYSSMPACNDINVDTGTGLDSVYDHIDGSATAVPAIRDVSFQGLLVRPCNGRVRIVNSHGLWWFQAKDSMEFAYNIDGTQGYQNDDIYENIDVENNLYGYQFGSMWSYCLTCRLNLTVGGKIGLYANDAELKHRVGMKTELACIDGNPTDDIYTESSDTSLATLGELDFGLGYCLGCAWTIRGGYRMIGVGGVPTAIDSIPSSYTTLEATGKVYANDSYVLHGGYFGLECNW